MPKQFYKGLALHAVWFVSEKLHPESLGPVLNRFKTLPFYLVLLQYRPE